MKINTKTRFKRVYIFVILISLSLLFPIYIFEVQAQSIFPDYRGFGVETPGGRGGKIYKVTNLNKSGEGSLREAIEASGPRIVVFEISGNIDYDDYLTIRNPYITIAGQTAPSPGITLKGYRLVIRTHDVVIQHLRIRTGDRNPDNRDIKWLENRDCISLTNSDSDIYNVIIDHCSFSWSLDENFEIWPANGYKIFDVTISNCIISEGLYRSVRAAADPVYDKHSKGMIIGPNADRIAIIGNLFAHNEDRNPVLYNIGAVVVNNVIYNARESNVAIPISPDNSKKSIVGNYAKKGRNSSGGINYTVYFRGNPPWADWTGNPPASGHQIYVDDNISYICDPSYLSPCEDPWDTVKDDYDYQLVKGVAAKSPPLWPEGLVPLKSTQVKEYVLQNAGARADASEEVDLRIKSDVEYRTGAFINSQEDVGGWPDLEINRRVLVIPENPHEDSGDGYTNLEKWLHDMASAVETNFPPPNNLKIK